MDVEILKQLHDPSTFPGSVDSVEVIQTHLSVVCLAGDRAYKLKKPIRFDFVDFASREQRRYFCHEEVRLNRRLCPEVYLGVVFLLRKENGVLFISRELVESCELVDHAVEMVRLPAERMLDRLLNRDEVVPEDMRMLAEKIAGFHRSSDRSPETDEAGAPGNLERFAADNFEELRHLPRVPFDKDLLRLLEDRTAEDFEWLLPILEQRMGEGRVVDGHGDLHARNICLVDPVAIYDCIEFNSRFRCADCAVENAFLVMDLAFRGHRELADEFLDTYLAETGDRSQRDIMPVLVRYRAMVRAKVNAIASSEMELSRSEQVEAAITAVRYFHFAVASAIQEDGPWLIIASGLPGSGKSFACRAIREQTGWRVFGSDRIRKELAGVDPGDRLPAECYTQSFSARTYDELIERGLEEAVKNGAAILDANFRTSELRRWAKSRALKEGIRTALLSFATAEDLAMKRLEDRLPFNAVGSDADFSVYSRLREEFEPPRGDEADCLIPLGGDEVPESLVPEILKVLFREGKRRTPRVSRE